MTRRAAARPLRAAPVISGFFIFALFLSISACHSGDTPEDAEPTQRAAPSATPVDRLAPGELGAGKANVFGFRVPRGMRVEAVFSDAAHLSGRVDPMALASYVRDRVVTGHVEVAAARTTFPAVRIRGGDPKRVYRIEIVPHSAQTRLVLRDVTPKPSVEGLSEAERWRQAGMTPKGELLDPKSLE
jgi:hypothetical protein